MTTLLESSLVLTGLRARGRVGCKEAERAYHQMLRFDLSIDYDVQDAIAGDDVTKAVDYKAVAACVRELLESSQWRLLETLAAELGSRICELNPRISCVRISVTKDVIADAGSVAVIVVVRREG
jgi:dihydroneopterin aldolase